jgi:hypothetical protein
MDSVEDWQSSNGGVTQWAWTLCLTKSSPPFWMLIQVRPGHAATLARSVYRVPMHLYDQQQKEFLMRNKNNQQWRASEHSEGGQASSHDRSHSLTFGPVRCNGIDFGCVAAAVNLGRTVLNITVGCCESSWFLLLVLILQCPDYFPTMWNHSRGNL